MDRDLSVATVRRMVELVAPEWTVLEATPAEGGFCAVYRIDVETGTSTRTCFLKAATDGEEWGIPADARIAATLGARTSIPVPEVLGVVDDHPELPSPFHLTTGMPGCALPYEAVGQLPDGVLRTVARDVGACLGELHGVDAIDSFGYVDRDPGRRLAGEPPSGTVAELAVRDGSDSWPAYLRGYAERELERHADSRFSALTPRLESWCEEQIEALTGPFSPALGRNDHGLHNLLVDPDTGEVTAMLDWAYTLAVPPAFDLGFAEYLFGGSFLSGLPDVPDRRSTVREAMRAGYRSTAPERAEAAAAYPPLYELLAMVRVMNDFGTLVPELPEGTEDAVAEGLEEDVESVVEGG